MSEIRKAQTQKSQVRPDLTTEACILTGTADTQLGAMTIAATSQGVCLAEFSDRSILEKHVGGLRRYFDCPVLPGENEHLARLRRELDEYFAGLRTRFEVPLIYPGTNFQVAVWNLLLQIPYGTTRSYESAAAQLGLAHAARAVGTTNGLNRISVVIPCHRLINKNGRLGGYGGGLWRKQWLLEHEQRTLQRG